jgi:hypothetical protein
MQPKCECHPRCRCGGLGVTDCDCKWNPRNQAVSFETEQKSTLAERVADSHPMVVIERDGVEIKIPLAEYVKVQIEEIRRGNQV